MGRAARISSAFPVASAAQRRAGWPHAEDGREGIDGTLSSGRFRVQPVAANASIGARIGERSRPTVRHAG
ncbi:hypothetical protein [Acidihalobacter ferrooxydans]|uniref:Uncharacterized protein n=1 Tax=Acidihalobacter ferrooxydans TaxID=1765967 RepID=A0A1P8UJL1_9GAMM|nr:hypothetical protein [Acidihalobacter ferrooxydans]APZ44013.1 hypothetical protein BW247_13690 [Acidihalobacter ferrooxydans]